MFTFFQEAQEELSRVTWLTKKQAIHISMVTLFFVVMATIFIGGSDYLLSLLYNTIQ
ncbi:preprotein translocase subunit SecE [Candidatus Peregrinibacteria bacterium]|nr:MAG: preprotein translocase subunit SecE [Candidatus Peregrinibacteria bacterium]